MGMQIAMTMEREKNHQKRAENAYGIWWEKEILID